MVSEKNKQIPGYSNYFATEDGNIVSTTYKMNRILKPATKPNGRLTVNLWKDKKPRTVYVHSMIALAFHGEPSENQEVNHIDGNPKNNKPSNLEWCSRSHNQQHAFRTGLNIGRPGENNSYSKLKESEVKEILTNHYKLSQNELAKAYGVSRSAIRHVISRKTWKYLGENI